MVTRRISKWLWLLVGIPPIVAILTNFLAPEPDGHWREHLVAAAMKSSQFVLLLVLVTMLGWRTLRLFLLISFAVIVTGIVFQVLGDYQVAESIWRKPGNPSYGIGYIEGHDRSSFGDLLVMVGALAFAVVAGVTRRVRPRLAIIAIPMVIIPPPYFWPAAGVLVLVLYGLTSTSRFDQIKAVKVTDV